MFWIRMIVIMKKYCSKTNQASTCIVASQPEQLSFLYNRRKRIHTVMLVGAHRIVMRVQQYTFPGTMIVFISCINIISHAGKWYFMAGKKCAYQVRCIVFFFGKRRGG